MNQFRQLQSHVRVIIVSPFRGVSTLENSHECKFRSNMAKNVSNFLNKRKIATQYDEMIDQSLKSLLTTTTPYFRSVLSLARSAFVNSLDQGYFKFLEIATIQKLDPLQLSERDLYLRVGCTNRLLSGVLRTLLSERHDASDVQASECLKKDVRDSDFEVDTVLMPQKALHHVNEIPDWRLPSPVPASSTYMMDNTIHGLYLNLVVLTTTMSTHEAISLLSDLVQIPREWFHVLHYFSESIVSTQIFSIFIPEAQLETIGISLLKVNSSFQYSTLRVYPFSWSQTSFFESLTAHDVQYVQYSLVLRNIRQTGKTIDKYFRTLRSGGSLNYFSPRRFGTSIFGGHHIGKAVIMNDYGTALFMILHNHFIEKNLPMNLNTLQREIDENEWIREYNQCFVTNQSQKIFHRIYVTQIPIGMRIWHKMALQSYMWNIFLSAWYRTRALGDGCVLPGDLILDEHSSVDSKSCKHGLMNGPMSIEWEELQYASDSMITSHYSSKKKLQREILLSVHTPQNLLKKTSLCYLPIPTISGKQKSDTYASENSFKRTLSTLNTFLFEAYIEENTQNSNSPDRSQSFGIDVSKILESHHEYRSVICQPFSMQYEIISDLKFHTQDLGADQTVYESVNGVTSNIHETFKLLIDINIPHPLSCVRNNSNVPLWKQFNIRKRICSTLLSSNRSVRFGKTSRKPLAVAFSFKLPQGTYVGSVVREIFKTLRRNTKK